MSGTSSGHNWAIFQNIQDMDAYARDFYNEIRALSMDTGGSIENILDNIGASCESLSSLIPQEKRTVRYSNLFDQISESLIFYLRNLQTSR